MNYSNTFADPIPVQFTALGNYNRVTQSCGPILLQLKEEN